MNIQVNEKTDVPSNEIYLYLTGTNFQGSGIQVNTSIALSDINDNTFTIDKIIGGRLYVSYYNKLAKNPVPYSNNYYGYIELTIDQNSTLWVDISCVDVFGVPLGFSVSGHKLGYKKSHNAIVDNILKTHRVNGEDLRKNNGHGNIKIVGANVYYKDYPTFESYIQALKGSELKIINLPDCPLKYNFVGTFTNDGGISLKSTTDSNTFSIPAAYLNNKSIYLSNGECEWNNKLRPAMAPNDTCAAIYRDIMIGYNEGYFTPGGENNSSKFPSMHPFASGYGNVYAKLIHEGCDGYGYPFADCNLKTLINTPVTSLTKFTLDIMGDDQISQFFKE